jgi:integrase
MQHKANPLRVRVERGIYKRTTRDGKKTRYEVAFVDSDGRQRWRTVDRLQEARDLRAALVSKVKRGERVTSSRTTFADFADEWLDAQEPRLRPRTFELYGSLLRLHVKPRLGRRRIADVTVDDVARVVAELERDGYAGWTIRANLTVLGRVLGAAERRGIIAANPVRRLEKAERPRVERREFPSLDREAVGKLIAATPERYRLIVAVSVMTGLRQGEALGLRWQDVDVRAGTLRVKHQLDRHGNLVEPKTGTAKREVPIPPSLGRVLADQRELAFGVGTAKPTDFVFCSETGGPMHHRNIVRRGLERALATTGLPHLTWHDLRHVAASMLIAEGGSVAYVSRVLGHATPAITLSTYAHEFARHEHADRMRERMEAAYGNLLA